MADTRTYGVGERNPATLPGSSPMAEDHFDNDRNSRRWRRLLAWVNSPASVGAKY